MRVSRCWILCLPMLAIPLVALSACGQIITDPTPTPAFYQAPQASATPIVSPTAMPAPLTPLPTFTPTVTPTPVFYTVTRGDSLLAIARQYGVTVQIIQEANGIIDPHRLQVGQELLIPVDENVLIEPPTPTATPLPYEIRGINFHMSPSGRLWCLGEVENIAGVDLEEIEVAVSLFDESGEMLAFLTTAVEVDVVRSGERAPFVAAFDDPPERFATYQSVPLKGLPLTRQDSYHLQMEILSHQGEARGQTAYSVTGRVRNAGDRPAERVRVIITGYDENGLVVAVRKVAPADDQLPPGRSAHFEINLLSTAGTLSSYMLRAEGLVQTDD